MIKKGAILPLLTAFLLVFFQSAVVFVRAEELIVSSNASGSTNEVSVDSANSTTVTQVNNADVANNIDASANTGENTASDNSGSSTITTGDASQNIEVSTNLNYSEVIIPCCPSDINAEISGNGEDSTNSINLGQTSETNINISQYAKVSNEISGTANTGNNSADNNSGSVSISTGSIWVGAKIENSPINIYKVKGGSGGGGLSARIAGNGSGSTNILSFTLGDSSSINIDNQAKINNKLTWLLNTGGNFANGNLGDVAISTGDISFDLLVANGPINVGGVDWGCCDDFDPGEPPDGGTPPATPPSGTVPPGGPGAPGPSGLAAAAAGLSILGLSATGGLNFPINIWAGLFMLFMGGMIILEETKGSWGKRLKLLKNLK